MGVSVFFFPADHRQRATVLMYASSTNFFSSVFKALLFSMMTVVSCAGTDEEDTEEDTEEDIEEDEEDEEDEARDLVRGATAGGARV